MVKWLRTNKHSFLRHCLSSGMKRYMEPYQFIAYNHFSNETSAELHYHALNFDLNLVFPLVTTGNKNYVNQTNSVAENKNIFQGLFYSNQNFLQSYLGSDNTSWIVISFILIFSLFSNDTQEKKINSITSQKTLTLYAVGFILRLTSTHHSGSTQC